MKRLFTLAASFFFLFTNSVHATSSIYDLQLNGKYQSVQAKNADIIGWITIPHTTISYPLMQTTDNDYYLHHNAYRKKAAQGAIFMDFRNQPDFSDQQTIIYGHTLKNSEQMFSALHPFSTQSFYESSPYIIISLPDEIRYYKIFASYTTDISFYYLDIQFTAQEFASYQGEISRRSILKSLVTYQQEANILTLSTCSLRDDRSRFVIHAVLIDARQVP